MAFLEINNDNIYFEVHGAGEPLILLHGMGGNHATWYQQTAVFATGYQVIVIDQRGFGNSTDTDNLGKSGFVSDLTAVLDHLNIDKVALLGQSMGAGTAITFAAQNPERVSALIIADSLHAIEESKDVAAIMDKARKETDGLSQIERVLGTETIVRNPTAAMLYQQINSFNVTNRSNLIGQYSNNKVLPNTLSALGVPVMFIVGHDDVLFPLSAVRLVQEQVEGSFIIEFDKCGHSAFYERAQEFNDSVLSLLQMAGLEPIQDAHSNASGYAKV